MPLKATTRTALRFALCETGAAKNFADVVDAGSGTLRDDTKRRLRMNMGNRKVANTLITAVEAGSAIDGRTQRVLAVMLADSQSARDIATILAQ